MPSSAGLLSADRPLVDPADDRIGTARTARAIANAVAAMTPPDGLRLTLHGASGSGRTSVVNFVRRHLAGVAHIRVVDVDAWRYPPAADLHSAVLASLVPEIAPGVDPRAEAGVLRMAAAEVLRRERVRFLVVHDDLDRVGPERLAEVVRLVSAVLDLPNVVHLLVLARDTAAGIDLGKLSHVPFDMPVPEGLREMLFDQLRELIAANPLSVEVTDDHWNQIFSPGIDALIASPRDVVRLMNVLRLTYPPVCSEVNAVDFIAVEALRVFLPSLYDTLRRNQAEFAGEARTVAVAGAPEEAREFHDAWALGVPAPLREAVQTLVLRLFPAVPDFPGAVTQRALGGNARRELRVASPELFQAYFQLVVPEATISNAEMEAHMAHLRDRDSAVTLLRRLAGERDAAGVPRSGPFLARVADAGPAVPAAPIAAALLAAGDELPDRAATLRLVAALLGRMSAEERGRVLTDELARGGIATGAALVLDLGREHGRHGADAVEPEEARAVTMVQLETYEQIVLRRIRAAAEAGELDRSGDLASLLVAWRAWDRDGCVRWASGAVQDDAALVRIVSAFLVRVRGDGSVSRGPHGALRLDPQALRPYVDPVLIAGRVRRLARTGTLEPEMQTALDQFVLEYELRQESAGET